MMLVDPDGIPFDQPWATIISRANRLLKNRFNQQLEKEMWSAIPLHRFGRNLYLFGLWDTS
jgi:hypothetical protein